jgi:hypothetical protein
MRKGRRVIEYQADANGVSMLEVLGAHARPNNLQAMTVISGGRAAPASSASSAHSPRTLH